MSDLTEFLLARIAEEEAIALEVAAERVRIGEVIDYPAEGEDRSFWADHDGAGPSVSVGAHRVLVDVEAKRRIVQAFEDERVRRDIYNRGYDDGLLTTNDDLRSRLASNAHCRGLEIAMLALALPYADHPDYREEWKP